MFEAQSVSNYSMVASGVEGYNLRNTVLKFIQFL